MNTNRDLLLPLPTELQCQITSLEPWQEISTGLSGNKCYKVKLVTGETTFLKILSSFSCPFEFRAERNALTWLTNKVPVPRVFLHKTDKAPQFLLLSALDGHDASIYSQQIELEKIVQLCAEAMLLLHQLPIEHCPLQQQTSLKIDKAISNAENGKVDFNNLDESRKNWNKDQLVKELLLKFPNKHEDLVFTHGDFCLPNLIFCGNKLSGFIDLGRAGVCDRYQDIALLLRSLKSLTGKDCSAIFLKYYHFISSLNFEKLEFYRLLDEFF